MFDFVRNNSKLFQGILLLLILPSFALVGMQGYTSMMDGANAGVASVDGRKITQAEWDAALRDQIEMARRQNPTLDPKLFDAPEIKREALDVLVRQRVIQTAATKQHLDYSTERTQAIIKTDPQFNALYNPDGTVNKTLLASQGMSLGMLVERVRQDLTQRQVMAGIVGAPGMAAPANARVAFDALLQQREVQLQRFDAKDFAAKIEPSDAEIEAFYKDSANAALFQQAEAAKIEYIVLDLDALKKDVTVNEDDLRKYYDENASRYGTVEERRASHILIKADASASAAERAKAKAKAEELLAQLRKAPDSFAEVAKKNSQDEGSAPNGGDLDFFAKNGTMVKPFEDATFALKKTGDISELVESDFGYHIIKLTDRRGGDKKPFEAARAEVEAEVRKQLAQKRFSEVAEQFSNTVYEQSDSLKPAADKLKLNIQTATVQRTPAPGATGALASPKLLEAVFGNDALRNKRNTEAVDVGSSQLAAARVVEYSPAKQQELAAVKPKAREALVAKLAAAQAVKAGQERLAALQKNGADLAGLDAPLVLSRAKSAQLPRKVLEGILAADASKLPAVVGIDAGAGSFVVARIDKLLPRDPAVVDAKVAGQQYGQAWAAAEAQAYYNALKTHYKAVVKVSAAAPAASAAAN